MNWLWELPQTLLGTGVRLVFRLAVHGPEYKLGKIVILHFPGLWGGLCLGRVIALGVPQGHFDLEAILRHEAGHSRQSQLLGPLYLAVIGLPSLLWAVWFSWSRSRSRTQRSSPRPYGWFYTEAWANRWAWKGPLPPELFQTSGFKA